MHSVMPITKLVFHELGAAGTVICDISFCDLEAALNPTALTAKFLMGQRGVTWAPLGAGFGLPFFSPSPLVLIGSGLVCIR